MPPAMVGQRENFRTWTQSLMLYQMLTFLDTPNLVEYGEMFT